MAAGGDWKKLHSAARWGKVGDYRTNISLSFTFDRVWLFCSPLSREWLQFYEQKWRSCTSVHF